MDSLGFDLYAMVKPESRRGCILIAQEIIAELEVVEGSIDDALARIEADDHER